MTLTLDAVRPAPHVHLDNRALFVSEGARTVMLSLAQQRWLVEGGIWTVPDARLFELNSGMHESVIECSRNFFFIDALKRVDRLRRLFDYGQMLDRDVAQERCREHVELLNLVLAGKNKEASAYMHQHLAALGPLKASRLGRGHIPEIP